jgi:hypothetical protein
MSEAGAAVPSSGLDLLRNKVSRYPASVLLVCVCVCVCVRVQ